MNKPKAVTGEDIAKECGVSQATVSYVLNQKEGKTISAQTKDLILATAKRLHYYPNSAARNMRCGKVHSIGIVSGVNVMNIDFNRMLDGAKKFLSKNGYSITLLSNEINWTENVPEYVKYYRSSRIAGILFISCELEEETIQNLNEYNIPFISASDKGIWTYGMKKGNQIKSSILDFVNMCKEREFKKIDLFCFNKVNNPQNKNYIFKDYVEKCYPESVLTIFNSWDGQQPNNELIETASEFLIKTKPDVAISVNQRITLIVQHAIMKNNFSLPQFPKHISLSASGTYQLTYPTITSFNIPLNFLGEYAAEQLFNIVNGEDAVFKEFNCSLYIGKSTE